MLEDTPVLLQPAQLELALEEVRAPVEADMAETGAPTLQPNKEEPTDLWNTPQTWEAQAGLRVRLLMLADVEVARSR